MKQSSSEFLHLICFVHLIICLAFICVPTDHAVELGGVLVSPTMQWAYATFCCFSVISIIAAGVGNVYNIAAHVDIYYYMLLLSALADVAWLVLFLVFGHACHTMPSGTPKSPHLMKIVTCAVTSGGVLVCLIILFVFKVLGMTTAARTAKEARARHCEELLPYLNKSMGQLASVGGRQDALQPTAQDGFDAYQASQQQQMWQGPPGRTQPSLSFRSAPASARAGAAAGYPVYGSVESMNAPELGQAATSARTAAVALSGPAPEEAEGSAPSSRRSSSSSHSLNNPFSSAIFGTGELPQGVSARSEDRAPAFPTVVQAPAFATVVQA